MKILGIIPARYASTRFPGKPLTLIEGKPMIQRVYERVCKIPFLSDLVVATDDQRIESCVKSFNGNVVMTNTNHKSGTDRCGEVIGKTEYNKYDIVINIQGDEPYLNKSQIEALANYFSNPECEIVSLKKEITNIEELNSPNVVKVITTLNNQALYFSRFAIPFQRNEKDKLLWLKNHKYYKHIGLYAYRTSTLKKLVSLQQSQLEIAESLEQLRWLENGFTINIIETFVENVAIDVPEDLNKLKQ